MVRSCNSHPLTNQPKRHSQKPEDAHDHSKNTEGQSWPGSKDPVSDEERPRKSNNGPHDRGHDEAVAMQRAVRVDDLMEFSGSLATVIRNMALHS